MKVPDKTISIAEVASLASVHRSIASRVLNSKSVSVSDSTRKRILKAAKTLGFKGKDMSFEQIAVRNFGLITGQQFYNKLENPFFSDVFDGIQTQARKHGINIYLVNNMEGLNLIRLLEMDEFLGFIAIGHINKELLSPFEIAHKPLVGIEAPMHLDSSALYSVCTDGSAGMKIAAQHLLSSGFKKIFYLGFYLSEPSTDMTCFERATGVASALMEAGIYNGDYQINVEQFGVSEDLEARDAGYRAMKLLLTRKIEPPYACICYSDLHAIGAYQAIEEAGLRIPDDISIIGYDNIELCESVTPKLSTVSVPREMLGKLAVKALLDIEKGNCKHKIVVPTELVMRESVTKK